MQEQCFLWERETLLHFEDLLYAQQPNYQEAKLEYFYLLFSQKQCVPMKSPALFLLIISLICIQNSFSLGALFSCSHMNLSCDQQIPQTCAISGYLRVLLLHLCPVCALKAVFPGLHTPVMDCMKYVTAPRGALHQYNSPELTSSAALQQCCISHRATEI